MPGSASTTILIRPFRRWPESRCVYKPVSWLPMPHRGCDSYATARLGCSDTLLALLRALSEFRPLLARVLETHDNVLAWCLTFSSPRTRSARYGFCHPFILLARLRIGVWWMSGDSTVQVLPVLMYITPQASLNPSIIRTHSFDCLLLLHPAL